MEPGLCRAFYFGVWLLSLARPHSTGLCDTLEYVTGAAAIRHSSKDFTRADERDESATFDNSVSGDKRPGLDSGQWHAARHNGGVVYLRGLQQLPARRPVVVEAKGGAGPV